LSRELAETNMPAVLLLLPLLQPPLLAPRLEWQGSRRCRTL